MTGPSSDRGDERRRVEELWSRWLLEGKLAPGEECDLVTALEADPELAERLRLDQRTDASLLAMGRSARDGDHFADELFQRIAAERDGDAFVSSFVRRVRGESWVWRSLIRLRQILVWLLVPAAACIGVWAGLWLAQARHRPQPPAPSPGNPFVAVQAPGGSLRAPGGGDTDAVLVVRVESAVGQVRTFDRAREQPASVGDWLSSGAAAMTHKAGSQAVFAFDDGTRLRLGGNAVLARLAETRGSGPAAGKAALLARGRLTVEARPQPPGQPLRISTPHADVSTGGARFALFVGETTCRVDVEEGSVELVRGDAAPVTIPAAHYAVVEDGGEPVIRPQPTGVALFVVGRIPLTRADYLIKRRLEARGYDVRLEGFGPERDEDLGPATLIVISSTVSADEVNRRYRDAPVPVIDWEPLLFADLGMTGPLRRLDSGYDTSTGHVVIERPSHPLAAGLSGTAQLLSMAQVNASNQQLYTRRLTYGAPGPEAVRVAAWPGQPDRALIFAYERGSEMPGMPAAPARRVGLFLHDFTATVMTESGWALFDAAVSWCAADRPRP